MVEVRRRPRCPHCALPAQRPEPAPSHPDARPLGHPGGLLRARGAAGRLVAPHARDRRAGAAKPWAPRVAARAPSARAEPRRARPARAGGRARQVPGARGLLGGGRLVVQVRERGGAPRVGDGDQRAAARHRGEGVAGGEGGGVQEAAADALGPARVAGEPLPHVRRRGVEPGDARRRVSHPRRRVAQRVGARRALDRTVRPRPILLRPSRTRRLLTSTSPATVPAAASTRSPPSGCTAACATRSSRCTPTASRRRSSTSSTSSTRRCASRSSGASCS